MPRRPAATTQADIARAIRAAKAAGAGAVIIRGAEIIIRLEATAEPQAPAPEPEEPQEKPVARRRRIVL